MTCSSRPATRSPGQLEPLRGLLFSSEWPRKRRRKPSHRDELMVRDAVVVAMKGLGLSNYFIAQFFGVSYSSVAAYAQQHHRRVYKGHLQ